MQAVILLGTPPLKSLLLGELATLLDEFRRLRATPLSETDGAERRGYLQSRMKHAREKLDALKVIQRREKLVQDRKRDIEQDNSRRRRAAAGGKPNN